MTKKQRTDDHKIVNYGGILMSKKIIQILKQQKSEQEKDKLQEKKQRLEEVKYAQVHKSCKIDDTTRAMDNSESIPQLSQPVTVDDASTLGGVLVDVQFDDDDLIGFDTQPDLDIFIPENQISDQVTKNLIIDVTGTRSDVAHEEVVTTVQIHNPIKPQRMTKESKQPKLKMFLRDTAPSSVKSKKPSPEIAVRQQESSDKAVQKIDKSTEDKLKDARKNPGKYIVSIPQNKDTSKELPPVPEAEWENDLLYCERCNFSTNHKTYMKIHNTRKCLFLTVVERVKCPEEDCGTIFMNDSNFKDHINLHLGIYKYKCNNCWKTFVHQNQLACHKKDC